jgi:NAD(P)-dependent dehydrogenase (short-subunit alcohol dehydrogenase family)
MEKLSLEGKVAMVVGAGGGGHGTATSLAVAEAGADLVAVDISPERVDETKRDVTALGRRCLGIVADVRKKPEVERTVSEALAEFGGIHCLANIVGGMQVGQWYGMLDYPEDIYDDVMNLNLRYAFLTCQAVAKSMADRSIPGAIVNVSSVSALPTSPGHGPYGAAKAALIAMSKTMAMEWSGMGIRVNIVAPGSMWTPRAGGLRSSEGSEKTVPLGRRGMPHDVASAILYLLSDLSAYVTGHVLPADGGMTSKSVLGGEALRMMRGNN